MDERKESQYRLGPANTLFVFVPLLPSFRFPASAPIRRSLENDLNRGDHVSNCRHTIFHQRLLSRCVHEDESRAVCVFCRRIGDNDHADQLIRRSGNDSGERYSQCIDWPSHRLGCYRIPRYRSRPIPFVTNHTSRRLVGLPILEPHSCFPRGSFLQAIAAARKFGSTQGPR